MYAAVLKAKYFVSGAYYNESGLFKNRPNGIYDTNIGIDRFNLRSNIDMAVSSTTTVGVDLAMQYLINNYPEQVLPPFSVLC